MSQCSFPLSRGILYFRSDSNRHGHSCPSLILSQMCIPISRSNTLNHHPLFLLSRWVTIPLSLPCQGNVFPLNYETLFDPHAGNDPTSLVYKTSTSPLMLMRNIELVEGLEPPCDGLQPKT